MASTAGDNPHAWGLVLREIWRRTRQRIRVGPLYRWRFSGRTPERVLIAPPDLRPADPHIAEEIYSGRFLLGGHVVETGGQSPFSLDIASYPWNEALHSFKWLRHMRAAGTDLASANARALLRDWIMTHGSHVGGLAWQPGVTATRIIAWLQHSTVVLQGCELPFYRAFMRSLAMQLRYLRTLAPDMPDGEDRLRARIALALATLSLPQSASSMRHAARNLALELEHQILADGGHISRSPLSVLDLLADLLPLRQTYANQGETPPDALLHAVERMLPMLRFFRHADGNLARFNGVGATSPDHVMAVLQHDETQGSPVLHAPHSGFDRLAMGGVTVIADTGAAPPVDVAGRAHAGFLSFEMSSGRHNIIVNCGVDQYGPEDYRPLARATAAHSTATLNDRSSARFSNDGWQRDMIGSPLVGGPKKAVSDRRDEAGRQSFVATHDGYVSRFGVVHERSLTLRENGMILDGSDRFTRPSGEPAKAGKDVVSVRFHVHPEISVYKDEHGQVTLAAPGGEVWVFTASGPPPLIEDSIFFAGLAGPLKTRQFVISFNASEVPEIHWRLTRIAAAG
ncbi:MAG: heparinase II/III family protein [Notoacmeibacter sp.]|nr:heparinase II/III family protein [Notoacmeibacter sp.]